VANKIISRAEAKKRGLPTYNDTPCRKCGHSERYTNSGKCIECHKARNKRRKRGKAGKTVTSKAVTPAGAGLVPINSEPINKDWRYYVAKITAAWQKSVESIIETGAWLIEAKGRVEHGDWLKLTKKLPFGERTVQRLMEIARHPVLSNPTHVSHLPPSWGTIHALTRLPEPVLIAKIDDRTINPEMERGDVDVIVAEIEAEAIEVTDAPKSEEVTEAEWPKSSPDDDEVTEAEIIEEAPPSLAELVERWQNSLATMAGDTIALQHFRRTGIVCVTWARIVEIMRRKAEAA
jgi:hypothetical protein